jgi:hypothetical protein
MGVVYRAVHLALQRTVAVKLTTAPDEDPAGRPGWLREPRLMASLAHPHVVAVHDAGRAEGYVYLVMEYMPGGSLRGRMEPGRPWPLARAAAVLDQVAGAVEYIHGQGVLHLDLKPENVLYSADGQAKIADFGLSAPSPEPLAGADTPHQGTLDYAAPERLAGALPDPRYDVFSLASMAYELLTGRLPGRVYVPASRRNPRLSAALDDVLRRGLARDPTQRYPSVVEFRRALADACRPPPLRSRIGLTVAAVALTVVLAVGVWKQAASPPADRPTRLWVLYDQPGDLSMFAGGGGGELAGDPDVAVERVRVETPPRDIPLELPLPVWPTPRPVLVVRSAHALGFVYPLQDRTLGWRVVRHWPTLLHMAVPPAKNFVKAGGFDGDCLATSPRGNLWRVGDVAGWDEARRITLDRPPDRSGDPALLLSNPDPAPGKGLIGCYQPLGRFAEQGEVVVLRYRARARAGSGKLAVYAGMPVTVPGGAAGPAVDRVRRFGSSLAPEPGDPTPNRWLYWCPTWVTPDAEWQTYLVVVESPPFPTHGLHRNLVIDLAAPGQVWVDDVELFAWQPGGEP